MDKDFRKVRVGFWSGKRDLNPQPSAWEADTLPLSYSRPEGQFFMERETGFEPATSTLARLHSTTELLPLNEEKVYRRTPLLSSVVSQKTHISFPSFPYAA